MPDFFKINTTKTNTLRFLLMFFNQLSIAYLVTIKMKKLSPSIVN